MSRPPSAASSAGAPLPPGATTCKSPFLERAETFQQLEQAQKRKSQSESELSSLVRYRSTTPNLSPAEINQKDKEIWDLRQQIGRQSCQIEMMLAKLERAETLIAQQQATIRTQSKAIENPRMNATYNGGTPGQRPRNSTRSFFPDPHIIEGPPPAYSMSGAVPHSNEMQVWKQTNEMPTSFPQHTLDSTSTEQAYGFTGSNMMVTAPQMPNRHIPSHFTNDFGSPMQNQAFRPMTPSHRPNISDASSGFTPTHTTPTGETDPFGPPNLKSQTFNAQAPAFHPPQSQVYSPESLGSNPYPETSIVNGDNNLTLRDTFGPHDGAIAEQFDRLFASCKNWALNHCNYPCTSGDNALPAELKNRILRAATTQTAFPLMRSPETRYWLVTKIIIQYVIKHVLRQKTIFAGLDREMDDMISGVSGGIYQSTPASVRYVMLKSISEFTRKIVAHPKYGKFKEHLVHTRAEKLFWDVRSLKHQATLRDQTDMEQVMREAHTLAEMMNTSTDEFAFNWADVGDRFDVFSMKNICPRYGGCSDDEVRARWATVRLSATPEVIIRKNNAQGNVQEIKLHKMRVLLKIKNDGC